MSGQPDEQVKTEQEEKQHRDVDDPLTHHNAKDAMFALPSRSEEESVDTMATVTTGHVMQDVTDTGQVSRMVIVECADQTVGVRKDELPTQLPETEECIHIAPNVGSSSTEISNASQTQVTDMVVGHDMPAGLEEMPCGVGDVPEANSPVQAQVQEDSYGTELEPCATVEDQLEMKLLASLSQEKGNFLKGCKWAPDGLCVMYNSDDNIIRMVNTPNEILAKHWDREDSEQIDMQVCLQVREAEIIYDYTWWPLMNSLYPATCCFATTARDQPVHLWDAFSGRLRATYIAKNGVDEVKAAHCVAFSPDGQEMICGFTRELRLFYVDRPGDNCEVWPTTKNKRSSGQKEIISTADYNPDGSLVACGSYDGTAALYSTKNGEMITFLKSKGKGTTFVKYSKDGNRLYTGARKYGDIICWDLRYIGGDLFHLGREVDTNQRIYFDLACRNQDSQSQEELVISGGTDGDISVWDIKRLIAFDDASSIISCDPPILKYRAHRDCCNGVHLHPYLPVLATSSGQRHYIEFSDDSDSDQPGSDSMQHEENSLKFWHIKSLISQ